MSKPTEGGPVSSPLLESMSITDGVNTVQLWPSEGSLAVMDFDPGFPAVRANVVDRVGSSGTLDYSSTFGASAVQLVVKALPSDTETADQAADRFRLFMNPRKRPVLTWKPVGGVERSATLRSNQVTGAWGTTELRTGVLIEQAQWVNPEGRAFGTLLNTVEMLPNTGLGAGRTYNTTYNRTYAFAAPPFWTPVIAGNTYTYATITIHGPVFSPSITNQTQGLTIGLDGYNLAVGQTIVLDLAAKTAKLNGVTNIRSSLTERGWWALEPGTNEIRFDTDAYGAATKAVFQYRLAFI